MHTQCPGSASFKQPQPETFKCPSCGSEAEIWTDEVAHACSSCGKEVYKTGMQSCMEWCKLAEECMGEEKYKQYGEMKAVIRKQALIKAMEDYFEDDTKRIEHAKKVITYAEMILAEEEAEPNLVLAAAALHDIGIKNAEDKHGSSSAKYQEIEGPPVAEEILKKLEYPEEFIQEVCDIIGHHHHPREEETTNYKVLYDADLLVNSKEAGGNDPNPTFFTKTAAEIFLKPSV